MGSLEFGVLGPLEVRRRGEPIGVTSPKQRTLLSLLLLRVNKPVSQSELIDALWDGEAPRTARAAFQNYIHALRRLLGSKALERSPAGYVLRAEPGALDLERFRRLAVESRHGPAVERAAKLRDALALWRGSAFRELSAHLWAQAEIARLEEERLTALEDRVDADLELGEHAALVPELEDLVARHSLRERFWAQLMLALYRAGRQADALAAYRRAHETLVDGLGIEPGLVLKELQRAILVQDRALADPKRAVGSTLERAAALLPRAPRERAESLLEYGSALIRMGELGHAATTLEAAGRLASGAGEQAIEERVRVLLSYLAVFADGVGLVEHLAVAERAARVFEDLGDDAGLAFALSHQAHMLRETGRCELALEVAQRGAELASRSRDRVSETRCRRMAALCAAFGATLVDDALALCREIEEEETVDELVPPSVWDVRAMLLAQAGRADESRALYERELAVLRDRGAALNLTVGLEFAALGERAAGDLGRAAELLKTAYTLVRAEEMLGELPAVAGELASVLARTGDLDDARSLANESRMVQSAGELVSEVLWRRALALVSAQEGRHEQALSLSDEARSYAEGTDWLTFRGETLEDAAFVRRLAQDVAGASEALRAALAVYERKGNRAGAQRVRATLTGSDARV